VTCCLTGFVGFVREGLVGVSRRRASFAEGAGSKWAEETYADACEEEAGYGVLRRRSW
jgi:hypothetical protein